MNILENFDGHEIRWPGQGPHALYNRLSQHEGPEHGVSARVKNSRGATTWAAILCLCNAVIVEIDYPTEDELRSLIRAGSVPDGSAPVTPASLEPRPEPRRLSGSGF